MRSDNAKAGSHKLCHLLQHGVQIILAGCIQSYQKVSANLLSLQFLREFFSVPCRIWRCLLLHTLIAGNPRKRSHRGIGIPPAEDAKIDTEEMLTNRKEIR